MHKMAKNYIIWDISAQISIKFNLTIATNLKKSLQKMHECVFGVLALESESLDPRL